MSTRKVYMDYAATTPLDPRVLEAMRPYLTDVFGNPSSIHTHGREARRALDAAREQIAGLIGADASEIVFTSGGSESDNLAIKGTAFAYQQRGRHLMTSAIEHHASLDSIKSLERFGFEVTVLPVDEFGLLDMDALRSSLRNDTTLVSIIHANNEVGTIQPVDEISAIVKEKGAIFHVDSVQAMGAIPINVRDLGVDLMSMSAHKFYGPKGVGALYVRKGVKLSPVIHGGAQERNRRAGTENVAGVVGMAEALRLAYEHMEAESARLAGLRDRLISGILSSVDDVRLNGHPERRLPNNVNVSFQFIEGESLLLNLDLQGISGSSGSACTSGSLEPSHVLLAMGIPHEVAHGSLRLTLGRQTTEQDVDYVLSVIPGIVAKLREMSPLYNAQPCPCTKG